MKQNAIVEERIDAAKNYIESKVNKIDKYRKYKKDDIEKKVLWEKL